MLKFLVKIDGFWTKVDKGTVSAHGNLYWNRGKEQGTASTFEWQLAPETTNSPEFRTALWSGLDQNCRDAAIERRPDLALLPVVDYPFTGKSRAEQSVPEFTSSARTHLAM